MEYMDYTFPALLIVNGNLLDCRKPDEQVSRGIQEVGIRSTVAGQVQKSAVQSLDV